MKLNKFKVEQLSSSKLQNITGGKQEITNNTATNTSHRHTMTTANDNDSHSHDVD
ncbi:hypothetical protein FORMB_03220 [Formosa sp. Hel1_33_131]|uniref:hypothetical protein n=1 Tax=Formosa sp. Hel1_33_131 TaxID=1336794 RepID=UPI00086590B7|nr:hypothetical protein [Formosa sp. Hel1_33_131]AOR27383.1 hypothetical protein FORMB_03220 [Formosa sp. Hel1_33_131]